MADVRVVHKDGTTGSVPEAKLPGALKAGWHIETPEEAAQRTGSGPLAAFAEGAAAGAIEGATAPARLANRAVEAVTGVNVGDKVTQGIDKLTGGTGAGQTFDAATSGRGTLENIGALGGAAFTDKTAEQSGREVGEHMRATALANPTAAMLGNVGGQLAGMAASGGAGLLAKGGQAATAGLLARGVGQVGARAGGLAAAGVAEGALQGAAQANEDAFIENKTLTAQRLWGAVGLNGLLSGALGGGLGAAIGKFEANAAGKLALGATKSAEEEALETVAKGALGGVEPAPGLGKKLKEAIEAAPESPRVPSGRIGQAYESVASTLSGAERETVAKYGAHRILMGDAEALSGAEMAMNRQAIIDGAIPELVDGISAMHKAADQVLENVKSATLKKEHIARLFKGDANKALTAAKEMGETLQVRLRELDDVATYGGNKWMDGPRQFIASKLDELASATTVEEAGSALDLVKRQLQNVRKRAQQGIGAARGDMNRQAELTAIRELSEETSEAVRAHLTDDSIWTGFAPSQQKTNAAWQPFLDDVGLSRQQYMTRTGDNWGEAVEQVDPAKVGAWLDKYGTTRGKMVQDAVTKNLDDMRNLVETVGESYGLTGADLAAVNRLKEAHAKVVAQLGRVDKTVKVANQVEAMLTAERSGASAFLGGAGAVAGGLLGGIPGAFAGAAVGSAIRPGSAALQAARLQALAGNTVKRTTKALERFFGHAPSSAGIGKAAGAVARALPAAGRRAAVAGASGAEPAMAEGPKRRETIAALATNPVMMADQVDRFIGGAAGQLPKTHMALAAVPMRAIQFLASKLPPAPPPNALDGAYKAPISPVDQDRFNEYVKGATDPLSAVEDMSRGLLTLDRVEAIQAVYPELYEELRVAVFDYVAAAAEAKQPLAYQKRTQLDILFGGNGAIEPTLAPQYMRAIEAASQQMSARDQAQRQQSKRARAPDIASAAQSPLDRLSI